MNGCTCGDFSLTELFHRVEGPGFGTDPCDRGLAVNVEVLDGGRSRCQGSIEGNVREERGRPSALHCDSEFLCSGGVELQDAQYADGAGFGDLRPHSIELCLNKEAVHVLSVVQNILRQGDSVNGLDRAQIDFEALASSQTLRCRRTEVPIGEQCRSLAVDGNRQA